MVVASCSGDSASPCTSSRVRLRHARMRARRVVSGTPRISHTCGPERSSKKVELDEDLIVERQPPQRMDDEGAVGSGLEGHEGVGARIELGRGRGLDLERAGQAVATHLAEALQR